MTRVAFLGTPATAVPALAALASARGVQAVFCNPDRPQGRGRLLTAPPVKLAALDLGLPVFQPLNWKTAETRAAWEALGIELAVVAAYGHILPSWMLDSCPLGVWNLHYSLLPRWRGASPVNHAILGGDATTGVSLMRLTPGLDEGPVLARCQRPITLADTAQSLLPLLAEDAGALLLANLANLEDPACAPVAQDAALATFAPKLDKAMARLEPQAPALELHRQVRALQPWPGTELTLRDTLFKVCGVGAIRPDDHPAGTVQWDRQGAWLTAGDGLALELTRLQRPGKPIQPAQQALQPWGTSGRAFLFADTI